MRSHTKLSFTSSAGGHHAERISCKVTWSWKLQYVISSPLENVAAPLYGELSVALNFLLMSHSHAPGQYSVTRTKNLLSCACSAPSAPGYPQLARVNPPHAEL